MTRALQIMLLILSVASPAFGQGTIGVYADPVPTSCEVSDNQNFSVYVMLLNPVNAGIVDFKLQNSGGMSAIWLSDTEAFPGTTGQSQNGVTVSMLPTCQDATVLVLTVNYLGIGTSSDCSSISLVANPNQAPPYLGYRNCSGQRITPPSEFVRVNATQFCSCTVPVEETTWGGIKAIFNGQ